MPILEQWGIHIDNPLETFAYISQDLNHDLDFTYFSCWALAEGNFDVRLMFIKSAYSKLRPPQGLPLFLLRTPKWHPVSGAGDVSPDIFYFLFHFFYFQK